MKKIFALMLIGFLIAFSPQASFAKSGPITNELKVINSNDFQVSQSESFDVTTERNEALSFSVFLIQRSEASDFDVIALTGDETLMSLLINQDIVNQQMKSYINCETEEYAVLTRKTCIADIEDNATNLQWNKPFNLTGQIFEQQTDITYTYRMFTKYRNQSF